MVLIAMDLFTTEMIKDARVKNNLVLHLILSKSSYVTITGENNILKDYTYKKKIIIY